jgi:two-component system cell cycle sensor histidine kinase/response regulator CckA
MNDLIKRLLAFTGDGVYRYTFDEGVILLANQGLVHILDLEETPEQLVGRRMGDLMVYTEKEGTIRKALLENGEIHSFAYHFKTLKGEDRWVLHDSFMVRDPVTGQNQVEAIVKDITRSKKSEAALAAEKERLAVTLRSIGDGVIATNLEGQVVILNRVAEQLTGWTQAEAQGHSVRDIFNLISEITREPCEDPVAKVLQTGLVIGLANHTVLIARDGTERAIEDSGAPIRDPESRIIGTVLVFRDVTDKRREEAEYLRIEKLESIGLLAGGIAHDFNNILTALMGNISLLRAQCVNLQPEDASLLEEMEKASLRAKDLTHQLLTFAKRGAPVKEARSLAVIIRESSTFALRGSAVGCSFQMATDLWLAEVDPSQFSQVIQNLTINAQQAMPAGGTIQIVASNVILTKGRVPPLPAGPYVRIEVIDTGIGIPAQHLNHIFDPYFTTKQKGSGLGLTTTFSIIKKHDGHITVASSVGRGTTFSVYIPALPAHSAAREQPASESAGMRIQARILIVDDEESIRLVGARMLRSFGCEVETAEDAAAAIHRLTESIQEGKPFDLAILDLTLPGGMGGQDLVLRLQAIDPALRAVVSSGYSTSPVMARFGDFGFVGVITKPYCYGELKRLLQRLLGNRPEQLPAP